MILSALCKKHVTKTAVAADPPTEEFLLFGIDSIVLHRDPGSWITWGLQCRKITFPLLLGSRFSALFST